MTPLQPQFDAWASNRQVAHLADATDADLAQRFADHPEGLWWTIRVVGDYRAYLKSELAIAERGLTRLLVASDAIADLRA